MCGQLVGAESRVSLVAVGCQLTHPPSSASVSLLSDSVRCDGEGRIIGGLAAIPGFGWWPIKAYRPCAGLSQAGMDYVRCVWVSLMCSRTSWLHRQLRSGCGC